MTIQAIHGHATVFAPASVGLAIQPRHGHRAKTIASASLAERARAAALDSSAFVTAVTRAQDLCEFHPGSDAILRLHRILDAGLRDGSNTVEMFATLRAHGVFDRAGSIWRRPLAIYAMLRAWLILRRIYAFKHRRIVEG
jgi:hypothetical protein